MAEPVPVAERAADDAKAISGGESGVGVFPLTACHLAPAVGGEWAGGGVGRELGEEAGEVGGGADEACGGARAFSV